MKLFSYQYEGTSRSGIVAGEFGIDVALLLQAVEYESTTDAAITASLNGPLPPSISVIEILNKGDELLFDIKEALTRTTNLIASSPHKIDLERVHFEIPTPGSQKFLCVGRNYLEHIKEAGKEVPGDPVIFTRYEDSFVAHKKAMIRPISSTAFDWEGELAVIIGKKCHHVSVDNALEVVAGYSILNDGSLRDYQNKTQQWTPGKNFLRSGSYGPYLVTADEIADPQDLQLDTTINGESVQSANTELMIFNIATVISFITEWTELNPGDVIATGTPAGVGGMRNPKWFLKDGDKVVVTIGGFGELANPIKDEAAH